MFGLGGALSITAAGASYLIAGWLTLTNPASAVTMCAVVCLGATVLLAARLTTWRWTGPTRCQAGRFSLPARPEQSTGGPTAWSDRQSQRLVPVTRETIGPFRGARRSPTSRNDWRCGRPSCSLVARRITGTMTIVRAPGCYRQDLTFAAWRAAPPWPSTTPTSSPRRSALTQDAAARSTTPASPRPPGLGCRELYWPSGRVKVGGNFFDVIDFLQTGTSR